MIQSGLQHLRRRTAHLPLLIACLVFLPGTALGQSLASRPAIGENYRVEISASWWKPDVIGVITSDRLDLIGSRVDFVTDLGFTPARIRDLRVTVRPGKKHKVRVQYTPLEYLAEGVLAREITFAGQVFPVALPVESSLTWHVWRVGYEWDVFYKSRGYIGLLFDARITKLTASLESLAASGSVLAEAPLPAVGIVMRAYPLPDLALNFEVSGMKLPESINPDHEGDYLDMDLSATVNITENLGISAGWRRMDTTLRVKEDFGELRFRGIWFGGAIRF
jgi:hypothetical protein